MLPRALTFALLGALVLPGVARAQDREWEEDYSQEWGDAGQPQPQGDGYDVSVDLNGDAGQVNLDTFQGSLAPYGQWVNVAGYGMVWRPHVAAGWRPYYYGRWEWTNEGWLWVSDEPFGWAAYHYGRWTYDGYYGWVWVPGYQWAPAWVTWRYSGDVVGWAPLGPGVSVYVNAYPYVDFWWTFVPCTHFVAYPVYSVAYAPTYGRRYFYATAPAPPVAGGRPVPGRPVPAPAWGGPPPRAIEQRVGRAITPVRVVPAATPGQSRTVRPGEVSIYRPGRGVPAARSGAPESRPVHGSPRGFRRDEGSVPRNQQAFPQAERGGPVYGQQPRAQSPSERGAGGAVQGYDAPRGGDNGPPRRGGASGAVQGYDAPRGGDNGPPRRGGAGGAVQGYDAPRGGDNGPPRRGDASAPVQGYDAPRGGGNAATPAPVYQAPRSGGNAATPAPVYQAPRGGGSNAGSFSVPHGGGGGGGARPAPSGGARGGGRGH
ncbi:MAG: hypothetical protein QM767_13795 [Anaeromyxobacter sp.]